MDDTKSLFEWKALATLLRCAIVDVELVNEFKMQESIKNSVPENISCLLKNINTPEGYNRILIFQAFSSEKWIERKENDIFDLSVLFQAVLDSFKQENTVSKNKQTKYCKMKRTEYYKIALYCIQNIYEDTEYKPDNFAHSELALSHKWAYYTSLRWMSEAEAFSDLEVQIYTTAGQMVPPFLNSPTKSDTNSSDHQLLKKSKSEKKQAKEKNQQAKDKQEKDKQKRPKKLYPDITFCCDFFEGAKDEKKNTKISCCFLIGEEEQIEMNKDRAKLGYSLRYAHDQ